MGTHGSTTFTIACAFHMIGAVVGAPSGLTLANKGFEDDVNRPRFNLYSTWTVTDHNECSHSIRVSGKGVKDEFDLDCNSNLHNNNELTSLSTDTYILYFNGNQKLSLFTDTPSTLIVIKGDTCARRTYTTAGKVTKFTETPMTRSECDKQLQKMEETKEEWTRQFEEEMAKNFPPCFPFCDESQSEDESVEGTPTQSKHKSSEDNDDGDSDDSEITDQLSDEYWR